MGIMHLHHPKGIKKLSNRCILAWKWGHWVACWSLSCQLLAACYLKQMKITHRKIKFLIKPSVRHVDCRPELQTTNLPHGDGRKKPAGMSESKKKSIFPHVMGCPSLHRVLWLPELSGTGFNQLQLSQGRQVILRKRRQRLQTLCKWRKGPWGIPSMWVWVALLPIAGSVGCLDYRWWRFGVGVVPSWENFRSRYLFWSAVSED